MLGSALGIDVSGAIDKSAVIRDKCVAMLESCLRANPHYFKANYWLAKLALDDDPRRASNILTKSFALTDVCPHIICRYQQPLTHNRVANCCCGVVCIVSAARMLGASQPSTRT